MNIDTYENLVDYLKEKAKGETRKISIFVKNLKTNKTTTIVNNTHRKYNWACIIYDPQKQDPTLFYQNPKDERTYYRSTNLKDAKAIGDYLLEHIDTWFISISKEDVLEYLVCDDRDRIDIDSIKQ